jgi:hypothetical protein
MLIRNVLVKLLDVGTAPVYLQETEELVHLHRLHLAQNDLQGYSNNAGLDVGSKGFCHPLR